MYFSLNDIESQIHFLQQIRDFQPTDADLKHFSSLTAEDLQRIPVVHRNMAIICKIPNFNLKLDILQSITEIREQCMQVEGNIQAALGVCLSLQNCEHLHQLLQFCLSAGNQLNEGARKHKIEAFSVLDSLPRFMDVKSSSFPEYTLLNYVVELANSQNPAILSVTDEIDMKDVDFLLSDIGAKQPKSTKRDGFYMLKAPVDFLSKSCAKAQESIVKIKEMQFSADQFDFPAEDSPEQVFIQRVQDLLQVDCIYQIIKCKELLPELEHSYNSLLVQFAEDRSTDPAQLFSVINQFLANVSHIKLQIKSASPKHEPNKPAGNVRSSAFIDELTQATKKLK